MAAALQRNGVRTVRYGGKPGCCNLHQLHIWGTWHLGNVAVLNNSCIVCLHPAGLAVQSPAGALSVGNTSSP